MCYTSKMYLRVVEKTQCRDDLQCEDFGPLWVEGFILRLSLESGIH